MRAALRRRPSALGRVAAWSVVETAPAFLIGHAVAGAIDQGFLAGKPMTGLGWLAVLGAAWLAAALAARQVILAVADIAEPFRDDLLHRVVDGVLGEATRAFHGPPPDSAALARATLQVELARDAFAALVTVLRGFAFTLVSAGAGLVTLAPSLAPAVLLPFATGVAVFALSLPALARRQARYLLADEASAETITSLCHGLRDITACGAESAMEAEADRRIGAQAEAAQGVARVLAARTAALAVGAWLPVVLVLAVARDVEAGVVVGALAYLTQSLAPALGGLMEGVGVSGVRLHAALGRITHSPPPLPSSPPPASSHPASSHPAPPSPLPLSGRAPEGVELALRGVTFAYGPHAEPVIRDLTLDLPEGEHLAVVGPSGTGKSTLAALIAGLLTPGEGTVELGGTPAGQVHPRHRVLIPQEAYVFSASLEDNLTYLAPDATPQEIRHALAELGAPGLPHADLDPRAMSAGERQLVALARAYLSPARLVILDEACCHLDQAAEARVEAAFAQRGGTLVVIAHRISSARRADRVLLLDGGAWIGRHEELVRSAAGYAELVAHWEPSS
ncbi:ABC transporter ATP-binding protein [Nonomuraea soli]|uniref:ATP-binding cassette subfamily C protein n=1 Tax=Nonomuraea soli TaxID=1032476 RepID=A0A7W0HTN8_9ACTN|nr:ABC transporter ATP-binding protein [Nonomuraea soli]MBA2894896.1 ATP-binding cassette subfamily C protein [Nonomuraea soli]